MVLRVGASYGKSAPCLVWCPLVFCHMTSQDHLIDGSSDLMDGSSSSYITTLTSFGDQRHCGSGDVVFLICHVTSLDHTFRGLCEFMGGSTS